MNGHSPVSVGIYGQRADLQGLRPFTDTDGLKKLVLQEASGTTSLIIGALGKIAAINSGGYLYQFTKSREDGHCRG